MEGLYSTYPEIIDYVDTATGLLTEGWKEGIEIAALCPDGIIEGVYMPAKKCIFGVEWHPEMLPDNPGYKLFDYFVVLCCCST